MEKNSNPREEKGKEIAQKQDVTRINDNYYTVKSQTTSNKYDVVKSGDAWKCTCPDHIYRQVCCKHIHAVEISVKIREQVKDKLDIKTVTINECKFCHSPNIKKFGIRKNKNYSIQRMVCTDCSKTFSINLGFEGMKASPQAITSAMQLYFTGESLRNVQNFLKLQGIKVSHVTIYNWIGKYTELMTKYLEKITPQVSDTWRADELFVKVSGNMKYLYALMDNDTRFWLAQMVSGNKGKDDIRQMLRDGKDLAGKSPKVFITDGAKNFHQAYQNEFYVHKKENRPVHIQHIHFKGDMNNNRMERLNNETRDREKVMRSLKKQDTPIVEGYRIFHNYFRPHMALDGKTPAEASGIKIEGTNKWITLIQNASKK